MTWKAAGLLGSGLSDLLAISILDATLLRKALMPAQGSRSSVPT
jgi:hypothetical protein